MTKKTKFHFSRTFAFKIIKAHQLADLRSPEDVNDVVKCLRDAGPVPETFVNEDALKAAFGHVEYLSAAFVWYDTPQGEDYWRQLANKRRKLSRKDRAILLYWAALDAGDEVDRDEPAS